MSYINTLTISQLYSQINYSHLFNYFAINSFEWSIGLITEANISSRRSSLWDHLTSYKRKKKYNRVFIYEDYTD